MARRSTTGRQTNITGRTILRIRLASKVKITQEDMAGRLARAGVPLSQSQISHVETGRRTITDVELVAFAKALRVPVAALFA